MPRLSPLVSTVLADRVIYRIAERYGLSAGAVRVCGLMGVFTATGGRINYRVLADALGFVEISGVHKAVAELVRQGRVSKHRGRGAKGGPAVGLLLEPAGQQLVTILERAESQARTDLSKLKLDRWTRTYVRSGKYAGRAARLKERAAAKRQDDQA